MYKVRSSLKFFVFVNLYSDSEGLFTSDGKILANELSRS